MQSCVVWLVRTVLGVIAYFNGIIVKIFGQNKEVIGIPVYTIWELRSRLLTGKGLEQYACAHA